MHRLLFPGACASFKEVEHSCAQCGSVVEEGRPFCPQCRAPQVRVAIAPRPAEAGPDTSGELSYPQVPAALPAVRADELDRRIAVRVAIQAGLLGLVISMIPFLGIVLTGALAVYLYRRAGGLWLSARAGSRLGAAAGTVSFAISSFFMVVRIVVFHAQQEYQDMMVKVAQALGLNPSDAEIQEMIHRLSTPAGLAVTLFFSFIIGVALAAIGGALASGLLHPRPRR